MEALNTHTRERQSFEQYRKHLYSKTQKILCIYNCVEQYYLYKSYGTDQSTNEYFNAHAEH